MAEWLEKASQWHEVYCHDLAMEVMSSNPGRVKLVFLSEVVFEPNLSSFWNIVLSFALCCTSQLLTPLSLSLSLSLSLHPLPSLYKYTKTDPFCQTLQHMYESNESCYRQLCEAVRVRTHNESISHRA